LVAYIAELRKAGFTCFRDSDKLQLAFKSKMLTSIGMILADFFGLSPLTIEPAIRDGMVSIPGSLLIRSAAGWRKYIPDTSRLRRLRKGLERLRRSGGVFHVWFHPENLYPGWPRHENVVARFLEELGSEVRNGNLRCLTMGQLAQEFVATAAVLKNDDRELADTASLIEAQPPALAQPKATDWQEQGLRHRTSRPSMAVKAD